MPMVWSILTHEQKQSSESSIYPTSLYKSKKSSVKMCTVPIKFDTELKEKYKRETGLYIFKTKFISYIILLLYNQHSYLSVLLYT